MHATNLAHIFQTLFSTYEAGIPNYANNKNWCVACVMLATVSPRLLIRRARRLQMPKSSRFQSGVGTSTIVEIISVDLFKTHLVLLFCKAILFLVNTNVHDL